MARRAVSAAYLMIGALLFAAAEGSTAAADAADINGAWSTNVDACSKVFIKKGNQAYLAKDADMYGSGFVVDGTTVRGKIATCKVTSRKDDGATIHLQAACATDIIVSSNQVDLKMIGQDQLIRIVPGIPEMDTHYYRCPQQ